MACCLRIGSASNLLTWRGCRLPTPFGLLAAHGNDCAGALAFIDPTRAAESDGVRWLDGAALERVVATLRAAPLGASIGSGVRVSLGGVQEKFVAVVDGERVGLPLGSTPSAHILKPTQLEPDGSERYPGIVEAEHYCMTLARTLSERAGSPQGVAFQAPMTSIRTIAGRQVLCVERYDRSGTPVQRVHQEDGCQAMGLPPDAKYQQLPGGQPSVRAIADVNQELGLRIGGEYHLDDVDRGSMVAEAVSWGVGGRAAEQAIDAICAPIIELAGSVLSDFGSVAGAAPQVEGVAKRVRRLAEQLSRSEPS
ncbi:MAG: HipA domain-containing protein [Ilumatobacteraceae bacterium]